jgi:NAD(P)-dependent dehydrogenase (short-subunit alcohol dehydrogenase family)
VPIGRAGRPEEIAEAIVWLASDSASYVHGTVIDVGGGR